MTNEEAIRMLAQLNKILVNNNSWLESTHEPLNTVFDMAIKALEQKSCEDWKFYYNHGYEQAKRDLACDDWYDVPSDEMTLKQARQAVKDLRKKLAEYLEQKPCVVNTKDLSDDEINKFVEEMKKVRVQVIPKEPCEDYISREKVLMEIDKYLCGVPSEKGIDEVIKEMTPVTPQPKTGHWIAYTDHQACSCCGNWIAYYENDFNYCPNCGTKMEVEE